MEKRVLLLVLLIATPVFPRRSSSGGGNFGRGSSSARKTSDASGQGGGGGATNGRGGGVGPLHHHYQNQHATHHQYQPPTHHQHQYPNTPPQQPPTQPPYKPNHQPTYFTHQHQFTNNAGGGVPAPPPVSNFRGHPSFQNSGVGSRASSVNFKTVFVAGAVGGIIVWEGGKAIIRNANEPFHQGGRNYYFGDQNYKRHNGMVQCSMPLSELQALTATSTTTTTTTTTTSSPVPMNPNASTTTTIPTLSPDNVLNTIQFSDGTHPKTVTWGCRAGSEVCCGTECCHAPVEAQPKESTGGGGSLFGTIVLLIVIFLLFLCCVGFFIVCKFFGDLFDSCRGEDKGDECDPDQEECPMKQYDDQPNYSEPQQYDLNLYPPQPQQQYQNQGYPPQPHLPNQYNPNQHPAYPTHQQY